MNINVSGVNQTKNTENSSVGQGQNAGGRVQVSAPQTAAPSKEAGIALLQRLNAGDVFTGKITNITQNRITLLLSNSSTVTATLSDALSFNIGDLASFAIKDNSGEQIVLKSVNTENLKNLMNDRSVRNAIQNAGLSVNETTVSLVHNLMKQNMPIDAGTLNKYVRLLENVPNATPEDAVLMSKMGIPVTEENVNALHDYYDFRDGISGRAADMADNAAQITAELAAQSPEEAAQFIRDFTSAYGAELSPAENMGAAMDSETLETLSRQLKDMAGIPGEGGEAEAKAAADPQESERTARGQTPKAQEEPKLSQFQEQVRELADKVRDGGISAKEFLKSLSSLMDKPEAHKEALGRLVSGGEFGKALENMVRQEMFLKPEDINKDSLKRLYAKIINDSDSIAQKFGGDSKMAPLVQNANQTSNDVHFLNDASHFMSFVQIPIKMSGQNAHGDLYVYTNKRSRGEQKDELKALLHLDMDNLGPMDIFVALKNSNVTTNFKVANDEILDYIEAHMPELTAALNRKGYNVVNTVEISSKDYSFKSSVIEEELPPAQIKRFTFDVRA
ncbi:MAG: flagellar hook-length control protein FliK [Butyrivibrio sp.]|nr:flagellar hook-length control protein FliK [Butyrivibrio sp.]